MSNLEQEKINREQKLIKEIVENEGWPLIREKFLQKVSDMANILAITNPDPNKIMLEIMSKQLASGMILGLLKDIEGTVAQYDINSKLKDDLNKGHIVRMDV